jgi:hypothetical protein
MLKEKNEAYATSLTISERQCMEVAATNSNQPPKTLQMGSRDLPLVSRCPSKARNGIERRARVPNGKMEVAGIEPASEKRQSSLSTRLVIPLCLTEGAFDYKISLGQSRLSLKVT